MQIWLVSSRTPRRERLQAWGYAETGRPGVYRSQSVLVNRVGLLALNQLSAESHNAFVKVFASRREEKENAFRQAGQVEEGESPVQSFLRGLRAVAGVEEEYPMTQVITPEFVMRLGEELTRSLIEMLTPEERLAGLKPEERVAGVNPDDLLALFSIEDIEAYLERHHSKREATKSGVNRKQLHRIARPHTITDG